MDEKLEKLFAKWSKTPFKWGSADCCQFAASAMLGLHGVNIILPKYQTEKAAIRAIQKMGGFAKALQDNGLVALPSAAQAVRGDVILASHQGGGYFKHILAVCTGHVAHTTGPVGLVEIGRKNWLQAWRLHNG